MEAFADTKKISRMSPRHLLISLAVSALLLSPLAVAQTPPQTDASSHEASTRDAGAQQPRPQPVSARDGAMPQTSPAPSLQAATSTDTRLDDRFAAMDVNGDGFISRSEFGSAAVGAASTASGSQPAIDASGAKTAGAGRSTSTSTSTHSGEIAAPLATTDPAAGNVSGTASTTLGSGTSRAGGSTDSAQQQTTETSTTATGTTGSNTSNSSGLATQATTTGSGASASAGTSLGGVHSASGDIFTRLDVDADGRVSAAEAGADPDINSGFSRMDSDGDGYVTGTEFRAQAKHKTP